MSNGLHLMGIKPVKTKMIHGLSDVVMKVNLRAVEWLLWGDVPVVYEGFAEVRVGLYGFNILRKFHVYIGLHLNFIQRVMQNFDDLLTCFVY